MLEVCLTPSPLPHPRPSSFEQLPKCELKSFLSGKGDGGDVAAGGEDAVEDLTRGGDPGGRWVEVRMTGNGRKFEVWLQRVSLILGSGRDTGTGYSCEGA